MGASSRENLLVAKGVLGPMGGAERDLIRILPSLNELFSVSMATIQPSPELVEVCSSNGIALITPESDWEVPRDSLSTILDSGRGSASRAWRSCEGLDEAMSSAIAIHLVSGDGSLPILDHVPSRPEGPPPSSRATQGAVRGGAPQARGRITPEKPLVDQGRPLQGQIQGQVPHEGPDLQGRLRSERELQLHRKACEGSVRDRGRSAMALRRRPRVPRGPIRGSREPLPRIGGLCRDSGQGVLRQGDLGDDFHAIWVGTLSRASRRGDGESIEMLRSHAESMGVDVWFAPRLSSPDLVSVMRGARAMVSMAHNESFGLTPIESFSVGTPALFVDEGGFRDTIVDGENGRLIDRSDIEGWHSALEQASDQETREEWAARGRERISELDLGPDAHARRIRDLLCD